MSEKYMGTTYRYYSIIGSTQHGPREMPLLVYSSSAATKMKIKTHRRLISTAIPRWLGIPIRFEFFPHPDPLQIRTYITEKRLFPHI